MTTDLKSMGVEELLTNNYWSEDWEVVARELARRLEEAEQKIWAQKAKLMALGYAGSDIPMSELTAIKNEMKAQALEEASRYYHEIERHMASTDLVAIRLKFWATEYRGKK